MALCLVVDDSPTVRLMISANIRRIKEAHDVIEANEPEKAMEIFSRDRPDVVFLDMKLGSQMAGLDLLRRMLALKPMTHIVIISGLSPEHPDIVDAMSEGAFAFLRKPVRSDVLESLLRDIEKEGGHLRRVR